jgi:DNA-binding transcriptional LysR family regulator
MDVSGVAVSDDALASFAVFAEHLNLTRAAAELRISQPSLHVKIRKLADRLGRPLYRRDGRRFELTPGGVAVARFAREQQERRAAGNTPWPGAAR